MSHAKVQVDEKSACVSYFRGHRKMTAALSVRRTSPLATQKPRSVTEIVTIAFVNTHSAGPCFGEELASGARLCAIYFDSVSEEALPLIMTHPLVHRFGGQDQLESQGWPQVESILLLVQAALESTSGSSAN